LGATFPPPAAPAKTVTTASASAVSRIIRLVDPAREAVLAASTLTPPLEMPKPAQHICADRMRQAAVFSRS
jgi:hypothetical protein